MLNLVVGTVHVDQNLTDSKHYLQKSFKKHSIINEQLFEKYLYTFQVLTKIVNLNNYKYLIE